MNTLIKTGVLAVTTGLVFGMGSTTFAPDAEAAWEPKKSVEFVIMAGKGGGADRLARFIQGLIASIFLLLAIIPQFPPVPSVGAKRTDRGLF